MKILFKLICVATLLYSSLGFAAGGNGPLFHVNVDVNNRASLQRGAKLFVNYCLSCHSASFSRYNRVAADLQISISNEGLFVNGMASLPGGISDFTIEGELSKERLRVKGTQMTNINFGNGARLKTDLSLEASTDSGVFLSGMMERCTP